MKKNFTSRTIFIIALIFIGSFLRLIPHWPNFTPIAAIALFGGTFFNKKFLAFFIPFVALLISDLIIGFHEYMLAVYISFAITVSLGFLLRKNIGILSMLTTSVVSSVIFFLITNFAVWLSSPFYTQNIHGLLNCYYMGLPFINNMILGDVFYNSIFFAIYIFSIRKFTVLA